ncbi:hypothetical protein [Caballeronia sordidicola]|nr:hypothetical protein [Caballeronia sordidicola]
MNAPITGVMTVPTTGMLTRSDLCGVEVVIDSSVSTAPISSAMNIASPRK